ncbi:UTP--glucose-1-phosphate uridylyltransferase [Collybia nuda]|uniref:UTP--glucose-1-phosphate uridylyltransferase n=1 Tax=Collybia nuda TaxID=64659 RepID=A0A9P5YHF1_9AGAR|nr:UTP--glucose-1-phosphate uridylyltransferase [Collybia nuda]
MGMATSHSQRVLNVNYPPFMQFFSVCYPHIRLQTCSTMWFFQYSARRFRRFRRRAAQRITNYASSPATKTMRNEINKLIDGISDPTAQKAFATEMQGFIHLYKQFVGEGTSNESLVWERIKSPAADQILSYDALPESTTNTQLVRMLAVLKINSEMRTDAKNTVKVKGDTTLLDLTVQQIEHLNASHHVDVPLILMTSFDTHDETLRALTKYDQRMSIIPFKQAKYPKLLKDSLLPCPNNIRDDKAAWYTSGHGDLYNALYRSGMLDQLLKAGKQFLFVSNADNLGAVVDTKILQYMSDSHTEFIMEVTNKTKVDMKSGTLIDYDGTMRLLEGSQISPEHSEEFKCVRKFQVFNTNNLWINLKALKKVMIGGGMDLEIIVNRKITNEGNPVIQLETAAGAAIRHFKSARGVNVPRSRFLPVRSCSDLLLMKSDVYTLEHGRLVIAEDRAFGTVPVINFGDHFEEIEDFQQRFKTIPKILDLDHLTVSGDVVFGRDVTLRGTVIVVANEGQQINIPDGCILENRLISGNLTMTEL